MKTSDKLIIFKKRLRKLNIEIDFSGNLPWIYISKINGQTVTEQYMGNHGFTVAFLNKELEFIDLKEIFNLIRKYNEQNRTNS